MLYESKQMEEQAVLQTAAQMCAAARTAPKATGKDQIVTYVLTGAEKDQLADQMDAFGLREFGENAGKWYGRDAKNVRAAQAVVLIGIQDTYRGIQRCGFCGFGSCAACKAAGGHCAFAYIDLGIALSSACLAASAGFADSRIMFSIGKAAEALDFLPQGILWHGVPISVTGKSPFFDRK
ncbi:MAG: ferredoxin domain-containing protein [Candidatus Avoscillospira sp.]